MQRYSKQTRLLAAVDCIIFGFDGYKIKLLAIKRGFSPQKGRWSLMGGFLEPAESIDQAANRVLKTLTGLEGVYLEQLGVFSDPRRDPVERTISTAYSALIDISQYEKQLSDDYKAEWFELDKIPRLVFDHDEMVKLAHEKLKYKASLHPLLFELLPEKFTIPQLQSLYESVFNTRFDNRNFSRKVLSTGLLIKQKEKDRNNSKKGAFYFKLDKRKYKANLESFLNLIPNANPLI